MSSSSQPANADAAQARATAGIARRLWRRLASVWLVLHTLRHLRLRQWVYLFIRRILPDRYRVPDIAVVPDIAMPALRICAISAVPHHYMRAGRLCFLNESAHFDIADPDWASSKKSRLWRYNLHYFEFLSDLTLSLKQRNALIDSWIANNPIGQVDGWEPYPVSLRIISWARYFDHLLRNGTQIDLAWRRSFYLHCDWLFHHMEFHIDANHLFKNIVALYLGSHLLRGEDERVQRWQRKSAKWLSIALREQFNDDGGHYERSPMYHLLCLHYCLDVYNALSKSHVDAKLREQMGQVITRALQFARMMQHGNGRLALFNDSANGIAPDLDTLCRYAQEIDGYLPVTDAARYGSNWFADSGYFCWHDERQHLVVSASSPSPAYQPGHCHADCLSYEYSLDGVAVIVNAGNTCYEDNEDRRYARSTAAHNTVEIDSISQSELWSVFRLARRACVRAMAPQHTAQGTVLAARHDGYAKAGVIHEREFVVSPGRIEIRDTLAGSGLHCIRMFTHVHPDFAVVPSPSRADTYLIVNRELQEIAQVRFAASWGKCKVQIERTHYFDQFGMRQLRDTMIVAAEVQLPCSMQSHIEPLAACRKSIQ